MEGPELSAAWAEIQIRGQVHGDWPQTKRAQSQGLLGPGGGASGDRHGGGGGETRSAATWGFDPIPPSVLKIQCLGAALRAGGYLAAEAYLSAYKVACQRGIHA